MADIYWKVPLASYPDVCRLIWEAHMAELHGEASVAAELSERIRNLPGFPTNYDRDHDILNVVPKDARITFEPWPAVKLPPSDERLLKRYNQ